LFFVRRTAQYKRRVPLDIQGVVIDGVRLKKAISLSLKDGMTRAKAEVFTDELFGRARAQINFKLTEPEAWKIATDRDGAEPVQKTSCRPSESICTL
jgi:hypothetical protein